MINRWMDGWSDGLIDGWMDELKTSSSWSLSSSSS